MLGGIHQTGRMETERPHLHAGRRTESSTLSSSRTPTWSLRERRQAHGQRSLAVAGAGEGARSRPMPRYRLVPELSINQQHPINSTQRVTGPEDAWATCSLPIPRVSPAHFQALPLKQPVRGGERDTSPWLVPGLRPAVSPGCPLVGPTLSATGQVQKTNHPTPVRRKTRTARPEKSFIAPSSIQELLKI